MSNANPFSDYIRDVRANIERGDATEHTHRPALKTLLEFVTVLHSPTYRERYAEFLKIDFPRLPLTANRDLFFSLAGHGADLVALHLLQSPKLDHFITDFPEKGTNEVDRVVFVPEDGRDGARPSKPMMQPSLEGRPPCRPGSDKRCPTGRAYINATQYFGGIPQATVSDLPIKNQKSAITNPCVWSFRVGGYLVCEKWLKDRKGLTLDYADIQHYQKVVVALNETIRLMAAIDHTISNQGGWPGAFGGGRQEVLQEPHDLRNARKDVGIESVKEERS